MPRPARAAILSALALTAGCHAPLGPAPGQRPRPPNIVVILADDLGYGDVAALNPDSKIPTPHLDALARSGMTFTDAHTPSAVCTPTRYGLLTGRYCWRSRLQRGVLDGYSARLIEPGRRTVADVLRGAGYHTGIVGKWHLGLAWPKGADGAIDFARPIGDVPNGLGFDTSYIIPASLDFPPYVYIHDGHVTAARTVVQPAQPFPAFLRKGPRGEDLVMAEALDHLTGVAVDVIRAHARADKPFFLYFALTAPHKPALPHPRFRGRTKLGDYGDFVAQVDATVGTIVAAIAASGIADDTVLVYTSDNGSYMYRYDAPDKKDHTDDARIQGYRAGVHRANYVFRGTKADIWEAGHRVPFFVRWPGRVRAGARCDETICLTDLFATCAAIGGAPIPIDAAEDSFSFLPLLEGRTLPEARPAVVHHSANGSFAIRQGRWKLVATDGSGGRERPRGRPFGRPYRLFDVLADPAEKDDRLAAQPEIAARLEAELQRIRTRGRSRR